ncbi:hypothetical protein EON63_11640 [archaeon]|nr:MAG: hypothetical protein EON63_11640 [archaeon]
MLVSRGVCIQSCKCIYILTFIHAHTHTRNLPYSNPYLFALGIYNFCNPGAISHNEVLDLYKKYIDPEYTYTNFSVDEQGEFIRCHHHHYYCHVQ